MWMRWNTCAISAPMCCSESMTCTPLPASACPSVATTLPRLRHDTNSVARRELSSNVTSVAGSVSTRWPTDGSSASTT